MVNNILNLKPKENNGFTISHDELEIKLNRC